MKTFTEEDIDATVTDFLRRIDARRVIPATPEPFQITSTKRVVSGEELRRMFPLPRNVATQQKSPNSNAT
jgi:hypothetical protein